jgi:hypothetical protein
VLHSSFRETIYLSDIQVVTGASIKMIVFWVDAPRGLVQVYHSTRRSKSEDGHFHLFALHFVSSSGPAK